MAPDTHHAVTIHQPSIEIFEAFDSLLLLQRGGRTTYFGPLGVESSTLVSYLERVPGEVSYQMFVIDNTYTML